MQYLFHLTNSVTSYMMSDIKKIIPISPQNTRQNDQYLVHLLHVNVASSVIAVVNGPFKTDHL